MGNCLHCLDDDSSIDTLNRENSFRRFDEHRHTRRSRFIDVVEEDPIMHLAPGVSRPMSQLTEEEQIRIWHRIDIISTLPSFRFDENKQEKLIECAICMCDYEADEELRTLPCLHSFHRVCVDDWIMRSPTCPSCMIDLQAMPFSGQVTAMDQAEVYQPPAYQQVTRSTPPPSQEQPVVVRPVDIVVLPSNRAATTEDVTSLSTVEEIVGVVVTNSSSDSETNKTLYQSNTVPPPPTSSPDDNNHSAGDQVPSTSSRNNNQRVRSISSSSSAPNAALVINTDQHNYGSSIVLPRRGASAPQLVPATAFTTTPSTRRPFGPELGTNNPCRDGDTKH